MSGFHDVPSTPASVTTIGGINVAEGMARNSVSDALRTLGAFGRQLADEVDTSAGVAVEAYGAVGDGTTLDHAAIILALAAASALNRPLVFKAGKTYLIGQSGWVGFTLTNGNLNIKGNGATLKLAALPSQTTFVSGTRTIWKLSGCDNAKIDGLNFDMAAFTCAAICADACDDFTITNSGISNGVGIDTMLVWPTSSTGFTAIGNKATSTGAFCKVGHTDAGREVTRARLLLNTATTLEGDLCPCVGSDILIAYNNVTTCYAGVAISGYDTTGTTCSDVRVIGNRFVDYAAQGVQIDFVRTASPDVRASNIVVEGNHFVTSATTAAAVYIYGTDGFAVRNNTGSVTRFATLFDCTKGIVEGNGGAVTVHAVVFDLGSGASTDVTVRDNNWSLGAAADGVIGSGVGSVLTRVHILNNRTLSSGARGIDIRGTGHVGCSLKGNRIRDNATDFYIEAQDIDVADNDVSNNPSTLSFVLPAPSGGAVSLKGRSQFHATYGAPTTISSFTDMVCGRPITIVFTNGNTTINHGTIKLKGGANITPAANAVIALQLGYDNVVREI